MAKKKKGECFVIMPFSDPDGYEPGHFSRVYKDLFRPAIEAAGYNPKRADDDKDTSLIHLGMVQDLIEKPMAICDLSSANPNVLFELGFRQAFDMPTVIVQEEGTRKIFDIDAIRRLNYQRSLRYHEVVDFHTTLTEAILATEKAAEDQTGMNSIVGLIGAAKAKITEGTSLDASQVMEIIKASEQRTSKQIEALSHALKRGGNERSFSGDDDRELKRLRAIHRKRLSEMRKKFDSLKGSDATSLADWNALLRAVVELSPTVGQRDLKRKILDIIAA